MNGIKLKDILRFDELLKCFPSKRIKLRFNTDWDDELSDGSKYQRSFLKMYENSSPTLADEMLSNGSEKKNRNSNKDLTFLFIKINRSKNLWLFVDAYNIMDAGGHKAVNPASHIEYNAANAERLLEYEPYFGRLVIEWRNLPQQFFYVKPEIINNIELTEILPLPYLESGEAFPGYEAVSKTYSELRKVIVKQDWRDALSNIYGVYVLTDESNGKLYVGSATGEQGIYGRWSTYLDDGYDKVEEDDKDYPNKGLKELVERNKIDYIKQNFRYSIMEYFPKNEFGKEKAIEREQYWKKVLQSAHPNGYNYN
jgi:hypothetical protein